MNSAYKKMFDFYKEHKNKKQIQLVKRRNLNVIIYRRIVVYDCKALSTWKSCVYDNSCDIYKPLTKSEHDEFMQSNVDDFCDKLYISNSLERIKLHHKKMRQAIAKKNNKLKLYHYKIAKLTICNLKDKVSR